MWGWGVSIKFEEWAWSLIEGVQLGQEVSLLVRAWQRVHRSIGAMRTIKDIKDWNIKYCKYFFCLQTTEALGSLGQINWSHHWYVEYDRSTDGLAFLITPKTDDHCTGTSSSCGHFKSISHIKMYTSIATHGAFQTTIDVAQYLAGSKAATHPHQAQSHPKNDRNTTATPKSHIYA